MLLEISLNLSDLSKIFTNIAANFRNKVKATAVMDLIKVAEDVFAVNNEYPQFKAGDTVTVHYKIKEGDKERIQMYRGVVIQRKGEKAGETFTVRKMSGNIGVERIFPLNSPFIEKIEINKHGRVRRARIYYLRKLTGKKARIKEKRY